MVLLSTKDHPLLHMRIGTKMFRSLTSEEREGTVALSVLQGMYSDKETGLVVVKLHQENEDGSLSEEHQPFLSVVTADENVMLGIRQAKRVFEAERKKMQERGVPEWMDTGMAGSDIFLKQEADKKSAISGAKGYVEWLSAVEIIAENSVNTRQQAIRKIREEVLPKHFSDDEMRELNPVLSDNEIVKFLKLPPGKSEDPRKEVEFFSNILESLYNRIKARMQGAKAESSTQKTPQGKKQDKNREEGNRSRSESPGSHSDSDTEQQGKSKGKGHRR